MVLSGTSGLAVFMGIYGSSTNLDRELFLTRSWESEYVLGLCMWYFEHLSVRKYYSLNNNNKKDGGFSLSAD